MSTAQKWLDVVSNNLANASTIGYKKDGLTFADKLVRELAVDGGEGKAVGSLGNGATVDQQYTDFSSGMIAMTGNPLDMAVRGSEGAFAIQTQNGVRYTRDGAFQIGTDRQLVSSGGHPVLDISGQPIKLGTGTVRVSDDGGVFVEGVRTAQIGVFEGDFEKIGANLLSSANAKPSESPSLVVGGIESSNVNVVEEMVALIKVNRSFEMAQRSAQSQDESTGKLMGALGR